MPRRLQQETSEIHDRDEIFKSGLRHFGLGTPLEMPEFDRVSARSYVDHLLDWLEFRQVCPSLATTNERLRRLIVDTHTGVVNTWSLNAAAFKYQGCRFIAINAGTFTSVGHILSHMLSHPELLSSVGEPSMEDARRSAASMASGPAATFPENYPRGELPDIFWNGPVDPERWYWWWQGTRDALEFVLFHELAHHVAGHLEYRERRRKPECLSELEPFDKTDVMVSRAVEYDADRLSLSFGFEEQLRHPKVCSNRPGFTGRCRLWLTAVGTVLGLLHQAAAKRDGTLLDTHPHPVLRLMMLATLLVNNHAKGLVSWGYDAARDAWRQAMRDLQEMAEVGEMPVLAAFKRFGRSEPHMDWALEVMELHRDHQRLLIELESIRPW